MVQSNRLSSKAVTATISFLWPGSAQITRHPKSVHTLANPAQVWSGHRHVGRWQLPSINPIPSLVIYRISTHDPKSRDKPHSCRKGSSSIHHRNLNIDTRWRTKDHTMVSRQASGASSISRPSTNFISYRYINPISSAILSLQFSNDIQSQADHGQLSLVGI